MTNITKATQNAAFAFETYSKLTATKRAEFLETIANNIEALGDELLNVANKETNLPLPRLTGERGRTCFQLRMFANMLRKGDYVDATIDTAVPDKTPPKPDIRQMLYPLGPVVVFGASNFPFAYSTAGGDTASALAAGCPVIVKAHPAHLQTSTLVAEAIQQAIKSNSIPEHTFQHITETDFSAGKALVQDENITAVGFTGSRIGGRALYDYANARKNPIPVFAEMGSVNPVVLLEGALTANAETIAKNYAGSITLGMGQFCTNPGILIGVKSDALTSFANHLANELNNVAVAPMLHEGIQSAYFKNSNHALIQTGITCLTKNTPAANAASPVLTSVDASVFLANPDLAEEVFGPYSILVQCDNDAQLVQVWKSIQGQISTTIMGTDNDLANNKNLLEIATSIAGRVLLNGVPTGVEVCDSMVHGGPYPASTDSRFTAVGVKAVKRWLRPISFQNWPDHLLPSYLQNKNELGVWRTINGEFTKSDVSL
jgi:NADP-dependent aldehyde dehydrogenase